MTKLKTISTLLITFLACACSQEPANIVKHATSSAKPNAVSKNPYKVLVQKGDTLYSLARKNNVEIRDVIEANGLRPPYTLLAGQNIKLPKPTFHIVSESDNLYAISRSYGVDIGRLAKKNNISEPYNLTKGQKLLIPAATENMQAATESQKYDYSTTAAPITSSAVASSDLAPLGEKSAITKPLAQSSTSSVKTQDSDDESPFAYTPNSAPKTEEKIAPVKSAKPITANDDADASPFAYSSDSKNAAPAQKKPIVPTQAAADRKVTTASNKKAELFTEDNETPIVQNKVIEQAKPSQPVIAEKKSEIITEENLDNPAVAAAPVATTTTKKDSKTNFNWPVSGKVISKFGPKKGGLYNDGINIAAREGTPIKAADDGDVVYSGNELRGYGNMLLIKHKDGFLTSYAHTDDFLVKKGDVIKKGQVIAHVGQTGHVSTPQLHFSIRQGRKAIDPEKYL